MVERKDLDINHLLLLEEPRLFLLVELFQQLALEIVDLVIEQEFRLLELAFKLQILMDSILNLSEQLP